MKFQINASVLGNKLNALKKVINNKSSLPILDCFLFEYDGENLYATASDTEMFVKTKIEDAADVSEVGKVCVNAKQITQLLSAVGDDVITFTMGEDKGTVKTKNGKFNFALFNAEEYPAAQNVDGDTLTLDTEEFLVGLSRVEFAAGNDTLRPVMNGVYVDFERGAYVASDGHRLVKMDVEPKTGCGNLLLSRKAVAIVATLFGKNASVNMTTNNTAAVISDGNSVLVCRLVEGKYPNYAAVIHSFETMNRVCVDRKSLVGAIKRVSVFSSTASNLIVLHILDGVLKVSAQDLDFATSAEETLPVESENNVRIGFKGDFLLGILERYDADKIEIYLRDKSTAGLFKTEDGGTLSLLMPMMID